MDEIILNKLQSENKTLASIERRLVAAFIDNIILCVLLAIMLDFYMGDRLQEMFLTKNQDSIESLLADFTLYLIFIKVLYLLIFFYLKNGTIGNMVTKTTIISVDDFGGINFECSLKRAIVFIIMETFLLGLLFLSALTNKTNRHFADTFSKSVVINDN